MRHFSEAKTDAIKKQNKIKNQVASVVMPPIMTSFFNRSYSQNRVLLLKL